MNRTDPQPTAVRAILPDCSCRHALLHHELKTPRGKQAYRGQCTVGGPEGQCRCVRYEAAT